MERLNVKRDTKRVAKFIGKRLAGGAFAELAELVKEEPAVYIGPEAQIVTNWSDEECQDFGDGKS